MFSRLIRKATVRVCGLSALLEEWGGVQARLDGYRALLLDHERRIAALEKDLNSHGRRRIKITKEVSDVR